MSVNSALNVPVCADLQLRGEVESFLYKEAELLDEWRLSEWLELFTDDAVTKIPPLAEPGLGPADSLFVVLDDMKVLRSRVYQLLSGAALAESPRSKTCRLITNVRVAASDEKVLTVRANFHIHKSRRGQTSSFIGEYRYRLLRDMAGFRILEREAILAQDDFSHGYLSFIL